MAKISTSSMNSFWTAVLIVTAIIALPIRAANPDFSAHFESEDFWNTHAVYLATLTEIKSAPTGGGYTISFTPVKMISGQVEMKSRSLTVYPDSLESATSQCPAGFPHGVGYPTEILASEENHYHQVTIVSTARSLEDQALVAVVERIAKLRLNPAFDALLEGATSEFDLESEYGANRLLSLPDQKVTGEYLKRLQAVADDGERPAELRIGAETAVLKFSGVPESARSEALHDWLLGVVEAAKRSMPAIHDPDGYSERMRWLIYKLFDLESKQGETVDDILRLVADPSAPAELRYTACQALGGVDQKVFNFGSPDERFDRMFATYLGLLKETNPDLRIMGVGMLDRTVTILENYPSPAHPSLENARKYGDKEEAALQQAINVEKDARVMTYLQSRVSFYEHWKTALPGQGKK